MIMGFAARLGRGCTSGQALSGGALLSAGSWVFMFAVFGGEYPETEAAEKFAERLPQGGVILGNQEFFSGREHVSTVLFSISRPSNCKISANEELFGGYRSGICNCRYSMGLRAPYIIRLRR